MFRGAAGHEATAQAVLALVRQIRLNHRFDVVAARFALHLELKGGGSPSASGAPQLFQSGAHVHSAQGPFLAVLAPVPDDCCLLHY